MVESSTLSPLEDLRRLINKSIDTVQGDLARHGDPPLNFAADWRHPIRERSSPEVSQALKCISSAGLMLRALCDPEGFIHDIMLNHHDLTSLFVSCRADIATILGDRKCTAGEIAEKTGLKADKISRYLRTLCNVHIFREVAPNIFSNNELSLLFQSGSRKALVGFCAEDSRLSSCKAWDALTKPGFEGSDAVNRAAFNIAYQTDLSMFQYWREVRPDLARRAGRAFAGKGLYYEQYVASVYPWAEEQDGMIVDVGGGVGGVTVPILNKYPNLKLQVQDLPENEQNFDDFLKRAYPGISQSGRACFLGHDFFDKQPTKHANIYFLCHVIHDWPDLEATRLLGNLAAAMSPTSKLLICDHVVLPTYRRDTAQDDEAPEPLLPNWGASFTSRLDLQVMACINGKQRAEAKFVRLAAAAGLVVRKIWRNGDVVMIECRL